MEDNTREKEGRTQPNPTQPLGSWAWAERGLWERRFLFGRPLQEPGPCHKGQAAVLSPWGQSCLQPSQGRCKGLEMLSNCSSGTTCCCGGCSEGRAPSGSCSQERLEQQPPLQGCQKLSILRRWVLAPSPRSPTEPAPGQAGSHGCFPAPPPPGAEYSSSD